MDGRFQVQTPDPKGLTEELEVLAAVEDRGPYRRQSAWVGTGLGLALLFAGAFAVLLLRRRRAAAKTMEGPPAEPGATADGGA
jgi:hypothetical protein